MSATPHDPLLEPVGIVVCTQPVAGLQLSVVQGLPSLQSSGVPDVHARSWQVSMPLQRLPSLHWVPLPAGVPAVHC
jgi:hypothetical protein